MALPHGRAAVLAFAPALSLALALGLAAAAHAEPRVEGTLLLESNTAWRVYSPRVAQKFVNRAELDLEIELSDAWRLRGIGRLLWDPVGRLVGPDPDIGQSPVDRWQVGGSRYLEAELRELYADYRTNAGRAALDVRLGRQQVVWGQSFGLRVLDMVNPQDFREFILDDFNDARIGLWGARVDVALDEWSFQALWLPDFEPDLLADPESEFALDPSLSGLLPSLAAAPGRPPAAAFLDEDTPSDGDPSSWGYGLHVGRHVVGWDIGLYYYDRRDSRGVFERQVVPVADARGRPVAVNLLQRRFRRVRSAGFSFSTGFGQFVLWGEGAASVGRAFVVNDPSDPDGVVERPDLEYAVGLDWHGWTPLFANVQFIQLNIFDYDRAIDLDQHREFLSVLLRFDLLRETLFPQLFVLYGVRDNESMIRPSIEWRATDHLAIVAGADLFTGPRDGLLGQFASRRECVPVPGGLPLPGSGGCLFDAPPGRTSRVFLRFRYTLGFGG